ncbi:hypothetical protein, partial [Bradyrhizobium ottawaense]|uniref:hypothetical protein n=1 Tax=Bradyrhizobium ottawaense TaxID=931866 RepID=UPI0030C65E5F
SVLPANSSAAWHDGGLDKSFALRYLIVAVLIAATEGRHFLGFCGLCLNSCLKLSALDLSALISPASD